MISELVAGSACTKPPVEGEADGVTGVVDAVLPVLPVRLLVLVLVLIGVGGGVDVPPPLDPP